jgi:hypothetical protein
LELIELTFIGSENLSTIIGDKGALDSAFAIPPLLLSRLTVTDLGVGAGLGVTVGLGVGVTLGVTVGVIVGAGLVLEPPPLQLIKQLPSNMMIIVKQLLFKQRFSKFFILLY